MGKKHRPKFSPISSEIILKMKLNFFLAFLIDFTKGQHQSTLNPLILNKEYCFPEKGEQIIQNLIGRTFRNENGEEEFKSCGSDSFGMQNASIKYLLKRQNRKQI